MANFNFNKVILGGRLVATPELKTTPSGVFVTQITVAVSRKYSGKDESGNNAAPQADFIRVIAWRQLAEFICKYFAKGSSICIVGAIQTRTWTDQGGNKQYATEVIADEVSFVDSKGEGGSRGVPMPSDADAPRERGVANASAMPAMPAMPQFEELTSDDELPF